MERTVTYLYPDADKAAHLKVFQERTTQIKAFYFTRDYMKNAQELESAGNYAVYFLFDQSGEGERTTVYVGQSRQGIRRMDSHRQNKQFWSYCLLFVTDNNSFDALTIDYIEYHYIQKLKKSSQFSLDNKELRVTEPVVSIYDKLIILSFIDQIDFLLRAEGIDFSEERLSSLEKPYLPYSSRYKAKLYAREGKFVLAAGSIIVPPIESAKNWSDGGAFYERLSALIDNLLSEGKIEAEGSKYRTLVNLSFRRPSLPANLVSGKSQNGWAFFKGLDELREGNS
jgi:hypothetical protein